MKPATISQLKKRLVEMPREELLETCVRMAKFKVDNKELLTYLLVSSADELAYADDLCQDIDAQLIANRTMHKKTWRKIVRRMDKCLRFSGNKETELQVRIHFCQQFSSVTNQYGCCRVSDNLYATQLRKIEKAIEKVHPDLQFDYRCKMRGLASND